METFTIHKKIKKRKVPVRIYMDREKVDNLRKQIKSLGLDITIEDVMMGGFKKKVEATTCLNVQIKRELFDKYKAMVNDLEGYEINGRELNASVVVHVGFGKL